MNHRSTVPLLIGVLTTFMVLPLPAATTGKVSGTFVLAGSDAQLKYVRATRVKLDEKKSGYAVVISAEPPTGEIMDWKTAEPSKKGNFIHVMFESNGDVWVTELGHVKSSAGRFAVVTEVHKVTFDVHDGRLAAHIKTDGDQKFDEPYNVDLTFEAPLEEK